MGDSMMSSYARISLTLTVIFSSLLVNLGTEAKVFQRCELAKLLQGQHRLSRTEVATLVCIAQHTSGFNTATFGGGTGPAGGSHGIFQISDVYWCSTASGAARGCNLACGRLRDDDITDDLACVRQIHGDHQRISGDGYTAWQAYEPYCKRNAESYVADCLDGSDSFKTTASFNYPQVYKQPSSNSIQNSLSKSKIYNRCELAQELYYKHKMPMTQIPTFVCIAQHESNFDTSAVGRLNTDGSADHGLFQISDLYWCSHDRWAGGKACGLPCSKLLDNDITDDVRCVKRIYNEHEGISGDGFTAWTVYNRDCRNQGYEHVSACFNKPAATSVSHKTAATHPNALAPAPHKPYTNSQRVPSQNQYNKPAYNQPSQQSSKVNPFLRQPSIVSHQQHPNAIASPISHKPGSYNKYQSSQSATSSHNQNFKPYEGKVYKRCELAQEMYFKHKFPIQDIATWTCIAEHESRYDTSAVGRLNTDGSADHGLFQVSDLYWCTHDERGGKGCGLPCEKLLDSDISDDVKCIRTIHDEHTRISGDGFTAWVVYDRNCKKQTMAKISDCFEEEVLKEMSTIAENNEITKQIKPQNIYSTYGPNLSNSLQNHTYSHNLFLNRIKVENKLNLDNKKIQSWIDKTTKNKVIDVIKKTPVDSSNPYQQNPFLNNKNFNQNEVKIQSNKVIDVVKKTMVDDSHRYQQNPFLNNKNFNQNGVKIQSEKSNPPFNKNAYDGNPFLNKIPNVNDKNTKNVINPSTSSKESIKLPIVPVYVKKPPMDNKYLNSELFRKTSTATTIKPITTTKSTTKTTGTRTTERLSSTTSISRTTFAPFTTSKPALSTTTANTRTTSAVNENKTQRTTPIPKKPITYITSQKSRPTTSSLAKKNNGTTTTTKYNWNTKVTTKIPVTLRATTSQSTTTNKWAWTRGTTTKAPYTTTRTPFSTTRTPYATTRTPFTTTRIPYTTNSNKNVTSISDKKSGDGTKISKNTSKPLITKTTTTKWPQTTSTVKRVETKYNQIHRTTPIPKVQNTKKPDSITTKKPDPFDHPFFAKYKLQFEKPIQNKESLINKTQKLITSTTISIKPTEKSVRIGSTTTRKPISTLTTKTTQRPSTTTKRPTILTSAILKGSSEKSIRIGSTTTRKPTFTTKSTQRLTTTTKRPTIKTSEVLKGSSYYEKFQNNTNENTKTISVYGFGQNHLTQTRKPEGTHDLKHKNVTTPNVTDNKNSTQSLFDLYLKKWNKN